MKVSMDRERVFGTVVISVVLLGFLFSPLTAHATPIVTYTEILDDINDNGVFNTDGVLLDVGRNLERTRILGDGTVIQQSVDSIINAENVVSSNFGLSTLSPITYSHAFIAVPPVGQFMMASLTLDVFSVSGTPTNLIELIFGIGPTPNDPVFLDGSLVGFLEPGGPFVETTTTFSDTNEVVISLLLADDMLNVAILPAGTGLLAFPDTLAVRTSTFAVEYVPVPEPLGISLMIIALASLGMARCYKRANISSGG